MLTLKEFLLAKKNEFWSVVPDMTLQDTLQIMAEKNIGAVPVVEKGKIVGIFSERDFARSAALMKNISLKLPVKKFMTKKVCHVTSNNYVEGCKDIMTTQRIRHLPILEKNKILGIITIGDVVKHEIQQQKLVLRKVLDSVEEGKNTIRMDITFNIEQNILPLVKKLAQKHFKDAENFRLLEEYVRKIHSAYYRKLASSEFNFTAAEISIIKLIRSDYSEKEISQALNISLSTVKKHKYAIRGKLGIRNKSGALLSHLARIA